ncbi:MAG TPA: carboxypeptidase regulatory-like domain-containing protein, partial [Terriglobales bacterium]|nr:carboxypeptidase regulatory-like domain-containing protein [Terriglobales bacterium]
MVRTNVVLNLQVLVPLLILSVVPASAQFSSSVDGTVTDPSGAVVPNASVTLTNNQTGVTQKMVASSAGYFRFASLPPSIYTVAISAPGFKTALQQNVVLQVTEVRTVNVSLEIGQESAQVSVHAAAAPVQLNEASVTNVIGGRELYDIPLSNRNFVDLFALTPGVTGLPNVNTDIFYTDSHVNMNAGGNRTDSNNFIVNGASVTSNAGGSSGQLYVMPNIDAIQDVRVQVNNFSAEYGRNAGAQVSVVTKQGANEWHGTVSEYHEDNVLTSRTEFASSVPVYRRNDVAWTFGGPIHKNKTFFFATMDILRAGNASARPSIVPTPDWLNWMKQNTPSRLSTGVLSKFPLSVSPTSNFITAGTYAG